MQSILNKQLQCKCSVSLLDTYPGGRLFLQHEVIRSETRLALPTQLDSGMCLLLCTKCREHIVYHCCQVCLAMHH